jgi:uncharacterized membrane protein
VDTVEGLGERKVMLGLLTHLDRYEPIDSIKAWDQEVKNFFLTSDSKKRDEFIRKYRANYVFIGPRETYYMEVNKVDIELLKKDFITVYKNQDIEILKTDLKPEK